MSATTDLLGIVQLWHAPLIVLVLIFVALAFDFINGFHDAANSIATVVSTRVRLAASQKLTAIAEMSDGTYWSDSQEVIVTLAACLEDLI